MVLDRNCFDQKIARLKWTDECQSAFEFLKQSLTVVPLLAYPYSNKLYTLYTEASNSCIGSCLRRRKTVILPNVKNENPIYYLLHKLNKTKCKWLTIEKEVYVIKYSLQKLDYYLHGARLLIRPTISH